eukprot:GFKZ01009895.1.p1 GENE.GFKZ01009895.1~~GFKZ01009895.1.p1  ORF type:complete len:240 (-),score=31.75 GFKZ01009895.1:469-1188(-)
MKSYRPPSFVTPHMAVTRPLASRDMFQKALNEPVEAAIRKGHHLIAGVDEAGAGPLAGPVVAAAVMLTPRTTPPCLPYLNDSKRMTARRRRLVYDKICSHEAFKVGVGLVSSREIDSMNILQARLYAMRCAVENLKMKPEFLFVDGNRAVDGLNDVKQELVVGGDGKVSLIAMASVVAKERRDSIMRDMAQKFPGYGFEKHFGYCTRDHLKMLKQLGPCDIHRRSFRPVRDADESMGET